MRWLPLLLLLLSASSAQAGVWRDPGLRQALREATHVVRVKVTRGGAEGSPGVAVKVLARLKGRAPGRLEVGGFHDPSRQSGPTFVRQDQELILILRPGPKQKGAPPWTIPTPTFGRFRIERGRVRAVPLRDTLLRVNLASASYETYLRLLLGQDPPRGWLDEQRKLLADTSPEVKPAERARQLLALEALCAAGEPADAKRSLRFLEPSWPFQVRISACRALARRAGVKAAKRLFGLAKSEPAAVVRTVAIRELTRLRPPPPGLAKRLAELLPRAPTRSFRLSMGPRDPRLNLWASPKRTLLRAIARLGAAPARAALLAVLDEPKPPLDVFADALRALLTLKQDDALPRDLVARFRAEQQVGSKLYNRELCVALTRLTKQTFREDLAAWRRWAQNRK